MRRAGDRVAETGQTYWPGSTPLRGENATEQRTKSRSRATPSSFGTMATLVTLFSILATFGFPFEPVGGSDFHAALSTAYLFAAIVLIVLMLVFKVSNVVEILNNYVKGMNRMVSVVVILVLAWTLGSLLSEMGTANFIVEMLQGNVPGIIVPALIFLSAAAMSFATGGW